MKNQGVKMCSSAEADLYLIFQFIVKWTLMCGREVLLPVPEIQSDNQETIFKGSVCRI